MIARLRIAQREGRDLRTTGIVIAEVWRDSGGRQANLARLLRSVEIRAVDDRLGREAGGLLGRTGAGSAADATVVAVATSGDVIVTGDVDHIGRLVDASRSGVLVVGC